MEDFLPSRSGSRTLGLRRKTDVWGLVEFEVYVVRGLQGFWVSDGGAEEMKSRSSEDACPGARNALPAGFSASSYGDLAGTQTASTTPRDSGQSLASGNI